MRSVRRTVSGLALLALLPAVGSAQAGRNFKDSWFWGLKTGTMTFSTQSTHNAAAPMLGAEWLITRTRGALYVSGEQMWFRQSSRIFDGQGNSMDVGLHDMQRVDFAAMAFPKAYGGIRPYVGLGFALEFIKGTHPSALFDSLDVQSQANASQQIENERSGAGLLTIAGVQAQYRRASVFGQITGTPRRENFLFNGGAHFTFEAGVRYNIGSAIDRIQ